MYGGLCIGNAFRCLYSIALFIYSNKMETKKDMWNSKIDRGRSCFNDSKYIFDLISSKI